MLMMMDEQVVNCLIDKNTTKKFKKIYIEIFHKLDTNNLKHLPQLLGIIMGIKNREYGILAKITT